MIKELKFDKILNSILEEINTAKTKSKSIHAAGNIKSSGDEVEDLIRDKISLFLPERYLVKQGHIINSEGKVSNQLDIIIFDRYSTPKFFESSNNTVFYPIESVLAIGEIKKTLRKNDAVEFGKKIKFIKSDMNRKLVENSVYGGKIKNTSSLEDIVTMDMNRKYKNSLFSFMVAVDVSDINKFTLSDECKYMPNDIYILNHGAIMYGEIIDQNFQFYVEDENPIMDTWLRINQTGINCLGTLLNQLIEHLNRSIITPFSISHYMTNNEKFATLGKDISAYKIDPKKEKNRPLIICTWLWWREWEYFIKCVTEYQIRSVDKLGILRLGASLTTVS